MWALKRTSLNVLQEKRLQEMLRYAKTHSPWYKKQLQHIDADHFTLQQLHEIPIMTKRDLMDHWDDIVTDRSLKLEKAGPFLMEETGYDLYKGYHLFASGGSSGRRGMFVWSSLEIAVCLEGVYRYLYRDEFSKIAPKTAPSVVSVAAKKPVHLSETLFALPVLPSMRSLALSALDPIENLVKALNDFKPTYLNGYPSVLSRLALQAIKGRLTISPKRILVGAEPLLPALITNIQTAWPDVIIINQWGSTDAGSHAVACDKSHGLLHLLEDLVIVEAVDKHFHHIQPGTKSEQVLITNLYRKSMPVFRYVLDDRITPVAHFCPCGSKFKLIGSIDGRLEDNFVYGNVLICAEVFENEIMPEPGIDEYQIFQTKQGAKVWLVPNKGACIKTEQLTMRLKKALKSQGVPDPHISIQLVDHLERHPETGKLKRFRPLYTPRL